MKGQAPQPKTRLQKIFSKTVMRVINMNAFFLLCVADLIRFAYFAGTDVTEEVEQEVETTEGETTNELVEQIVSQGESFWFFVNTLFIIPCLLVLFLFVEFGWKESQMKTQTYFKFLDNYFGKGVFFLMIALMCLEKANAAEVIFTIIIFLIMILNILVGAMDTYGDQLLEADADEQKLEYRKVKRGTNSEVKGVYTTDSDLEYHGKGRRNLTAEKFARVPVEEPCGDCNCCKSREFEQTRDEIGYEVHGASHDVKYHGRNKSDPLSKKQRYREQKDTHANQYAGEFELSKDADFGGHHAQFRSSMPLQENKDTFNVGEVQLLSQSAAKMRSSPIMGSGEPSEHDHNDFNTSQASRLHSRPSNHFEDKIPHEKNKENQPKEKTSILSCFSCCSKSSPQKQTGDNRRPTAIIRPRHDGTYSDDEAPPSFREHDEPLMGRKPRGIQVYNEDVDDDRRRDRSADAASQKKDSNGNCLTNCFSSKCCSNSKSKQVGHGYDERSSAKNSSGICCSSSKPKASAEAKIPSQPSEAGAEGNYYSQSIRSRAADVQEEYQVNSKKKYSDVMRNVEEGSANVSVDAQAGVEFPVWKEPKQIESRAAKVKFSAPDMEAGELSEVHQVISNSVEKSRSASFAGGIQFENKELIQAAQITYLELLRNLKDKNFKAFDKRCKETVSLANSFEPRALVNAIAVMRNAKEQNLLHEAALLALENGTISFFQRILKLGFPLYDEDQDQMFPAFYLVGLTDDEVFRRVYNALVEAGFDLNHANCDEITFLEKLLIQGEVTDEKVRAILSTSPVLDDQTINRVATKVNMSRQARKNDKVAGVIRLLKDFISGKYQQ